MVNGNYFLYGDRPSSDSEIVQDHVHAKKAERKTRRKVIRSWNEEALNNGAPFDNETDSVKYEKKIKEPRLLRYVPTTDVQEHFVTDKFETYDLKPASEERPRRYAFNKKPKNPADGSVNYAFSRSSSTCSSPNGNLPTISEHGENYGTYRMRHTVSPSTDKTMAGYESKLDKYFAKPKEMKILGIKTSYRGSHPDSLYRVPASEDVGSGKMARLLRLLRWPLALIVVCLALAVFVYFLMPSNLDSEMDLVNSTIWEPKTAGIGGNLQKKLSKPSEKLNTTKEPTLPTKKGTKTPEIDFYEAGDGKQEDLVSILDKISEKRKLPVPPVFPSYINPEVQYGNEKADTDKLRAPKILDGSNTVNSTVKPHITQKPERPLAIFFKEAEASAESISRAESVNDYGNKNVVGNKDRYRAGYKDLYGREKSKVEPEPVYPPEIQEYYNRQPIGADGNFTSGHSKFFGISIEDAEKMMSTTQNSLYNTRVSPTLPTWREGDDATTKKYPVPSSDVAQCFSTKLPLCRGVLPYDLAGTPLMASGKDITTLLPQIEYLVASNCSDRVKQFVCALLEPECNPPPQPPILPCYGLCQAIKDSCGGYIANELAPVFNCRQFAKTKCIGSKKPCYEREKECGDGSCILKDWICDGTNDCPGGEDEAVCHNCEKHEFNCLSGGCIPKQWMCDGYNDCPNGEDESALTCADHVTEEAGEESAGSAPAPSVKAPNRLQEARHRSDSKTVEDSSKELLMTSDSNNALKRNFTRRPSPSRLTPYRPKARHPPPKIDEISSEEQTEKPARNYESRRRQNKTEPATTTTTNNNNNSNKDAMSSLENNDDIDFFEELNKKAKMAKKTTTDATTSPPIPRKQMGRAPDPRSYRMPPSKPINYAPSPLSPAVPSRLDKSINHVDKIIDGAAMLRRASEAAAAEARANPPPAFEKYEDEFPTNARALSSPCPSGELRCVDGRCITLSQLCDGTIDCSDHADEDNCYT